MVYKPTYNWGAPSCKHYKKVVEIRSMPTLAFFSHILPWLLVETLREPLCFSMLWRSLKWGLENDQKLHRTNIGYWFAHKKIKVSCIFSSNYKGNICHLPHEPCFRASKKYQPQCQPWINKPLGPWIVLLQSYHFLVANHHFLEVTHASQSTRVY